MDADKKLSASLKRRKDFADEICAVITKHYDLGLDYIEVAAFLSHQAYAAIDQIKPRVAGEKSAHRKLGEAHALIGMDFPGWIEVTNDPARPS